MNDSPITDPADDSRIDPGTRPEEATATDTAPPHVALLSNGRYGVIITAAGSGCSTWRGLDVTRWREHATRDFWGQFCYIRDPAAGAAWSLGARYSRKVRWRMDRVPLRTSLPRFFSR